MQRLFPLMADNLINIKLKSPASQKREQDFSYKNINLTFLEKAGESLEVIIISNSH